MIHIARSEEEIPKDTKIIQVFDRDDAVSVINHYEFTEGWYYPRDLLNRFLYVKREEWDARHPR